MIDARGTQCMVGNKVVYVKHSPWRGFKYYNAIIIGKTLGGVPRLMLEDRELVTTDNFIKMEW